MPAGQNSGPALRVEGLDGTGFCVMGTLILGPAHDRTAAEANELASVSGASPGDALAGEIACRGGCHEVERSGVGGRHRTPRLGGVPLLCLRRGLGEREGAGPTGA